LPEETANLIKRYLELRPLLFGDPGDWLFPGRGGRAKSPGTLGVQIKKTITKHTGLVVNAHLMRHIAAKIYLERHPGSIEVVRRVLVHESSETTIRHYAGFENKAALRHYDEVILEHRQTAIPGAIPGKLRKTQRRSE
jgi:integrase